MQPVRNNSKAIPLLEEAPKQEGKTELTWAKMLAQFQHSEDSKLKGRCSAGGRPLTPEEIYARDHLPWKRGSSSTTFRKAARADRITEANASLELIEMNQMINAAAEKGNFKEALSSFDEIGKRGLEPNTVSFNSILKACVRCHRKPKAFEFYQEMKRNRVLSDAKTYGTLISACTRKEQALQVFEWMKAEQIRPTTWVCNALINFFAAVREVEGTKDVIQFMKANKIKLDGVTCGSTIKAFVAVGKMDAAELMLDEMQEIANVVAYTTLIDGYAKLNDFVGVERVLDKMERAGKKPNEHTHATLIKAYGKVNKPEKALRIFNLMKSPDLIAYTSIIDVLLKAGQREKALEIARRIKEEGDEVLFTVLLSGCRALGQLEDVKSILGNI